MWVNLGDGVSGAGLGQLIARIREDFPDLSAVVTAPRGTAEREPALAGHDLREDPADIMRTIDRFFDTTGPRMAVLTGREHMPGPLGECRRRNLPAILLDSDPGPSKGLWSRVEDLRMRSRLRLFDRIAAISPEAEQNLIRAGADAERVEVIGPLAPVEDPPDCDEDERGALASMIGTRPVWLADSLVPEETDRIEEAHRLACRMSHRLLLIVVPRDPADAGLIGDVFRSRGWVVRRRSEGGEPMPDAQVFIADEGPEGSLWLRLAPITYLGGSFSSAEPADPYPAGRLGSAIIHGPRLFRAEARFADLRRASATRMVASEGNLGNAVTSLLSPDVAAVLAARAWEVTTRQAETLERLARLILDRLEAG